MRCLRIVRPSSSKRFLEGDYNEAIIIGATYNTHKNTAELRRMKANRFDFEEDFSILCSKCEMRLRSARYKRAKLCFVFWCGLDTLSSPAILLVIIVMLLRAVCHLSSSSVGCCCCCFCCCRRQVVKHKRLRRWRTFATHKLKRRQFASHAARARARIFINDRPVACG